MGSPHTLEQVQHFRWYITVTLHIQKLAVVMILHKIM